MARRLIDPRLLTNLADFFPQVVAIQVPTYTQNGVGEAIATWANLQYTWETDDGGEIITSDGEPILASLEHVDLPATIAPSGGQEVKREDQTYAVSSHRITLAGNFPAIAPTMRVIDAQEVVYDIVAAERDSQRLTTVLLCQIVT